MNFPQPNVFTTKGSGYSLARAAELTGISEGLLILYVSTGRFRPSIEHQEPGSKELMGWRRFVVTDADLKRLRKMVEGNAEVQNKHVAGTSWTIKQLALAWGLSTDTIRDMFKSESGVLKIERPAVKGKRPKRAYVTFTIPEDVAERVKRRLS